VPVKFAKSKVQRLTVKVAGACPTNFLGYKTAKSKRKNEFLVINPEVSYVKKMAKSPKNKQNMR
jgi:hypothetical protein